MAASPTRLAFLLLLLLAGGLSAVTAEDMRGTWIVDAEALFERAKKDVEPAQHAEVKAHFVKECAAWRWAIDADSIVITTADEPPVSATYRVKGIEGTTLTLDVVSAGKPEVMTVVVHDRALLITSPGVGGEIRLVPPPEAAAGAAVAAPAVPEVPADAPARADQPAREPLTDAPARADP